MKLLVVLTFVGLAFGAVDYEHVLQSPTELKNLFNAFTATYHKKFSRAEGPLRLRIFRNDLKRVVELNKEHKGQWESGKIYQI